jgi:hypothetical protein
MRGIKFATLLALIVVFLGYFACGLALQRGIAVPALAYWFFFLAIPCLAFLLVSKNERYNVILLLTVSTAVYSMYLLQSHTWYPLGRDPQFELQNVALILDTGKWAAGMGTSMASEHSVHPVMHILLAAFCEVTAIQPAQAMFVVPWLKGIGFTIFFYLFARTFLSDNRAVFFASLVSMGCFSPLIAPHREAFAIILFMGSLWLLVSKKRGVEVKAVLLLLVSALVMSHHFTAYIFILLSLALYFFAESKRWILHPAYPVVAVLSWINFTAFNVTLGYSKHFLSALDMVFTLRFPEMPLMAAASYYYEPFELILMLTGPLLVGLLSLKPFLSLLRSKRRSNILTLTLVLGTLLVIALAFYRTGLYTNSTYRIWGFVYISLSILAASFVWQRRTKSATKLLMSILVVVLVFTSMNLSTHGIKKWYVPREYVESYMMSDSMVNTAMWCKERANGSFFGDNLAYSVIGSWGLKEMSTSEYVTWYQTENNEILKDYDFLVFSPLDKVTYSDIFRQPTDPFAILPMNLSIIYASGDFLIYYNS